ncbi:MAG: MFS transporter [Pseudomonadota bacterium]
MNTLSKENILLLAVMLLSSFGAFSYFPYVSTALVDYLGLSNFSVPTVIAFGMFAGNTLAYIVCLCVKESAIKPALWMGYAMALLAVASMALAKFMPAAPACAIVAGSILLYRFAIGLSANLSRSLQMRFLPRREEKLRIFSYIKLCSSIAGALGPLAGSLVMRTWGFSGVIALSCACFSCALLLLTFVQRAPNATSGIGPVRNSSWWATLRSQPSMVYAIASTALLHYIFEAQIYASISLNIQHNEKNYVDLIALLFASNSLLLIVFVIPILKLVNASTNKFPTIAIGSFMSVLAIVGSSFAHSPLAIVLIAALFTVGEIITPQVMLDMATAGEQPHNAVGAVATFNFLTSGIGMSTGFWLGGVLPALNRPLLASAVWIVIYLAFLAMARYCTLRNSRGWAAHAVPTLSGS